MQQLYVLTCEMVRDEITSSYPPQTSHRNVAVFQSHDIAALHLQHHREQYKSNGFFEGNRVGNDWILRHRDRIRPIKFYGDGSFR